MRGFPTRLTWKDIQVLTALGRNPLDPTKELSKKADMTAVTFAKRMTQLYKEGILKSVSAQVSFPSLDLHSYFFFTDTPFETIELVERAMDLHPYTQYRVRCLGATNGHFIHFAAPNGSLPLLLRFFDGLHDMELIRDYRYDMAISSWSNSETDFTHYNVEEDTWEYDWGVWEKGFSMAPPQLENTPSVLDMMDERDMRLLRQLTINARDKRKDIADRSGVPNYFLTRRTKFYHSHNVIKSYRVIVHRDASRLFSTLMFVCKCGISKTEMFSQAVSELPFQSTLIPVKEGFILQTSLPSLDFPHLGSILQKHCKEVRILWSDYDSSMRYWLWDEPYQNGRWVSNRKFMVDEVRDQLKQEL